MIDYFFGLDSLFPYLCFFPLFLIIFLIIFLIGKKKINNKGIGFYGIFMGLSNRNILSLAFLLLYYYFILVSIYVNEFSLLTLILLVVPIVSYNLVNFYMIKFFIDILNTFIIFVLLYSKSIFYNYMVDVNSYWYVIALYILLCLFIVFYVTFVFIRRFKVIISQNKYVSVKSDS